MKYIISASFIILLAVIQITLLNYVRIFGIKPDLLLIYAVFSLLYLLPSKIAIFSCLASGLTKDIFGGAVFGINTFLFFVWMVVILRLSKKIYQDSLLFIVLAVFLISLINSLAFYALMFLLQGQPYVGWLRFFFRVSIWEALYTALISVITFKSFKQCASRYFIS